VSPSHPRRAIARGRRSAYVAKPQPQARGRRVGRLQPPTADLIALAGTQRRRPGAPMRSRISDSGPGPWRRGHRNLQMQRRRARSSELRRKQIAGDNQDDRRCDQHKLVCEPMRCPRRQETAPRELVRVRDACHTYETAGDRLSFRAVRALHRFDLVCRLVLSPASEDARASTILSPPWPVSASSTWPVEK
jgi:hypothetical protein